MRVEFDRLPGHVWAQLGELEREHQQRLAEAAAQPDPEPELPPADSEPGVARAAIDELTQELEGTPLYDETMREHLEGELSYYQDLLEFHLDDWRAIHAERRQAERVERAQAQKAERDAKEKAQVHLDEPTDSPAVEPSPGVSRRKDLLLRKKQKNGALQRDTP